jgi:hypothetical protein
MREDAYAVNKYGQRHAEGNTTNDFSMANIDPLEDVYSRVEHKFHYRHEEQGIFHPVHHQGLKLRNNGAADLFVDQDNGVRFDPETQTVNVFANHYKAHIHNMTSWLTGRANFYVGEHWQVKTKGKHVTVADGDVEIRTKKNMVVMIDNDERITIKGDADLNIAGDVSAQIDGNLNAKVKRHATIDVGNDLNVKAGGDARIEAKGTLLLRGSHLAVDVSSYDVPWMPHSHPQYALKGHTHPEYEDKE